MPQAIAMRLSALLLVVGALIASGCAERNLVPETPANGLSKSPSAWSSEDPAPPPETAESRPRSVPARIFDALVDEGRRYIADGLAFVSAPARWDAGDWRRAAGAGATIGVLFVADESIDSFARRQRSHFTDRVSGATTWIGGGTGFRVPLVLLVGGIAFSNPAVRDMGRDGLEACLFSGVFAKAVKNVAGRARPFETDGETTFHVVSSHDSFPSGHSTQAFAIASVIAMRAPGWVIPSLAYAAATVVAFDRINDRVHFASDVAAGAVIGTVTGRFLVARHRRQEAGKKPRVDLELVPLRSGLAAKIRY
jgi:membrane-associated phospholipid phosphatase